MRWNKANAESRGAEHTHLNVAIVRGVRWTMVFHYFHNYGPFTMSTQMVRILWPTRRKQAKDGERPATARRERIRRSEWVTTHAHYTTAHYGYRFVPASPGNNNIHWRRTYAIAWLCYLSRIRGRSEQSVVSTLNRIVDDAIISTVPVAVLTA